tara:strand:+ start:3532 stop:4536 length:1005 start_codon:yes stop_codon:yes gene_type:complete
MTQNFSNNFPNTRMRRIRQSKWIRNLIEENTISSNDMIWPIFLNEGSNVKEEIDTMPGVFRYSVDNLNEIVDIAEKQKINLVALFPNTPEQVKSEDGAEALNPDNLVCKALRHLKSQNLNFGLMCDVALDPYTNHGHDGLIDNNEILNDETIESLVKQSLLLAQNGADVIAPSDMMDGRIGAIRNALEAEKYKNTILVSYSAKYASSFYSPFRDAVGSKKKLKSDKKSYQMNIFNSDEALREISLDISEGADAVIVKPGIAYLDIIHRIKSKFQFPTFAYHVSGEYSLIKSAAQKGIIDENLAVLEHFAAFKRAGADAIISYYAPKISEIIELI